MHKSCFMVRNWLQSKCVCHRKNIACMMLMLGITLLMASYTADNFPQGGFEVFIWSAAILSFLQAFEFQTSEKIRKRYGYILLLVSPGILFYGMEFVNDNPISEMGLLNAALNYAIYLSVYLLLYAILNRISGAIILGNIFFFIYIVSNAFVYEYRGTPIKAWDFLAMQTAMNVAGEYELKLTYKLAFLMFWVFLLCLLSLKVKWHERCWKKRIIVSSILIIVIVGGNGVLLSKEFISSNGLRPDWWQIEESAKKHGMLWDLVAGIPYLEVEKPDGYSAKEAKSIQENATKTRIAGTQETGVKPDIIAIMNESFSDLKVLGDLQTTGEYMGYLNSLSENTVKGNLYVPIRGGLTSNSEFEFITGFTCAFLPTGTIAYQTVIRDGTYNLGQVLNEQGYHTTFMHPYFANGWNRNGVYRNFQFDQSIFLEDMELDKEKDYVRAYVSDEANYKKIIEQYEMRKAEGEKMFLFDVTMQNHGGYASGLNDVQVVEPLPNDAESAEYLSLIKKSDEAFQTLTEYFSQVETPTVILMFGDHQPALNNLTNALQEGTAEEDVAGKMEEYCVPFVVWANYDIEEKYYDGISVNFLQTILMETAGLPLDDYQIYLQELMKEYPVITNMGVRDAAGTWYKFEEAKEFERLKEYSFVQYWRLIENKKE